MLQFSLILHCSSLIVIDTQPTQPTGKRISSLSSPRGFLHCVYCNRAVAWPPERLASHVVSAHGRSAFQCPHCFHRTAHRIGLLMHQQVAHAGKDAGYIECPVLGEAGEEVEEALAPVLQCHQCGFSSEDSEDLSRHLRAHPGAQEQTSYACGHCKESYVDLAGLACHASTAHPQKDFAARVAVVKVSEEALEGEDPTAMAAASELDSPSDCEYCEAEEQESTSESDEERGGGGAGGAGDGEGGVFDSDGLRIELSGRRLYRCGNGQCPHTSEGPLEFRTHLNYCSYAFEGQASSSPLACFHCKRQFKHVTTLLDHLKAHGPRRYSCGLCSKFKVRHVMPAL